MNIVLIGYRGTGKSVVGKVLAERLNRKCVGMDAEIVKEAGMSIPEIVEKHDWAGFRDRESAQSRKLAGLDNLIIDTGGGIIERDENIAALRQNAAIFWLKASVDVIVARISGDTQRPALTQGTTFTEEVAEVLERRTAKYSAAADYEIDTDTAGPEQVADAIVKILEDNAL